MQLHDRLQYNQRKRSRKHALQAHSNLLAKTFNFTASCSRNTGIGANPVIVFSTLMMYC